MRCELAPSSVLLPQPRSSHQEAAPAASRPLAPTSVRAAAGGRRLLLPGQKALVYSAEQRDRGQQGRVNQIMRSLVAPVYLVTTNNPLEGLNQPCYTAKTNDRDGIQRKSTATNAWTGRGQLAQTARDAPAAAAHPRDGAHQDPPALPAGKEVHRAHPEHHSQTPAPEQPSAPSRPLLAVASWSSGDGLTSHVAS